MGAAPCAYYIRAHGIRKRAANINVYLESAYWGYRASVVGTTPESKGQFVYDYMLDNGCTRGEIEDVVTKTGDAITDLQITLTSLSWAHTAITPQVPTSNNSALVQQLLDYDNHAGYLADELLTALKDLSEGYVEELQTAIEDLDVFAVILDNAGVDVNASTQIIEMAETANLELEEAIEAY